MPNLVVYVPAGLARELAALGVSLEVQRRACHAAVKALANGGLGAGEPRVADPPGRSAEAVAPAAVSQSSPAPSPGSELAGRGEDAGVAERTQNVPVSAAEPHLGGRSPRPRPASSSKCPADTPRGARCKLCGEKH